MAEVMADVVGVAAGWRETIDVLFVIIAKDVGAWVTGG